MSHCSAIQVLRSCCSHDSRDLATASVVDRPWSASMWCWFCRHAECKNCGDVKTFIQVSEKDLWCVPLSPRKHCVKLWEWSWRYNRDAEKFQKLNFWGKQHRVGNKSSQEISHLSPMMLSDQGQSRPLEFTSQHISPLVLDKQLQDLMFVLLNFNLVLVQLVFMPLNLPYRRKMYTLCFCILVVFNFLLIF